MVLGADGALVFATSAGAGWLEELGRPQSGLPVEVHALAARIRRPWPAAAQEPRLQARTRTGRWAVLHASRLSTGVKSIFDRTDTRSRRELASRSLHQH